MRFIYIYLILTILAILSFIYYVLNVYYAEKYRPEISNKKPDISEATILIPVYNEEENIFRNVLRSVKSQGVKFIVVGDACNEPYKSITEEYGGKFILLEQHGGKRAAMVEGIKHINTKYVIVYSPLWRLDQEMVINELLLRNIRAHYVPDTSTGADT